jgi:hypothetical protein
VALPHGQMRLETFRAQRSVRMHRRVDTNKKALIGNVEIGKAEFRPKGDSERVNVHDFEDKKAGKVGDDGV